MDPLDVVENVTLPLACHVLDANPTVNSFSWYKGRSTTPIGLLSNISISKVIRTDSGEYRCEGSNGIGQNGVDTVYVNVLCKYQSSNNIMYYSCLYFLVAHAMLIYKQDTWVICIFINHCNYIHTDIQYY